MSNWPAAPPKRYTNLHCKIEFFSHFIRNKRVFLRFLLVVTCFTPYAKVGSVFWLTT